MNAGFIALIVALVLFILAAIGVGAGKYSLIAAGLAFVVVSMLVGSGGV